MGCCTRHLLYSRLRTAGFSLFELLIAMTLLVVAVSLVPAYLSKGVSTAELKSSVRQITAGLNLTRSDAVSRNSERVFLLDVEKREFTTAQDGKANELPKGLNLKLKTAESEQVTEDRGGIRFFPDGSSTGGEIRVSTDTREFGINVNWVTGKVAVYDQGPPTVRVPAPHSPIGSSEHGFSLIEVLVSFVLLSMALTVILQIFSTNLRNVDAARKQTRALVIAESKLATLGTEIPIEAGETTGESGDSSWRLRITPYIAADSPDSEEEEPSDFQLYDIAIVVSWERGSVNPELELRTLRIGAVE